MATITHLSSGEQAEVRLVVHPWAEQVQLDPVVHVPLDHSDPWVLPRPVPPQRPTLQLLVDASAAATVWDIVALLRTPGVIRLEDPAASVDVVVSGLDLRQVHPEWLITITGIEV